MKKSISFLLCGAMMMTGMYCKKDSSVAREYTNEETVQQMARDSDFVQLYSGMREYTARVGATGQVARFASVVGDVKEFNVQSRRYFDQMVLKFPIESEQVILQKARVVKDRYGLSGKKEIELRDILERAVNIVDPLVSADLSSARTSGRCWDDLIRRETRCDRDMAISGIEGTILGGAAVLAATGVGIPLAAGIATIGLISRFIRHSNCIDDALVDYKVCSNP